MKQKTALKTIVWFALAGVLFAGYLSISEISSGVCVAGCTMTLGLPVCVYGFAVFAVIFVLSIVGTKSNSELRK